LTERMDLYFGVVVTLMFLAGCFLVAVSMRERLEERKRQRVWNSRPGPGQAQKAIRDETGWRSGERR
jgi:hypothetical protein